MDLITYALLKKNLSKVESKVDQIENVHIHVCAEGEYSKLTNQPTVNDPQEKTIYLTPMLEESDNPNDMFMEWVYIDGNWEKFGSAGVDLKDYITKNELCVEGTYSEIVKLRNESKLIPGVFYRITNYYATVKSGYKTYPSAFSDSQVFVSSAKHPFDIIIQALSENNFAEDAKAVLNKNDNYFHYFGCNLQQWQIKYCLDNEPSRFDWADTSSGRGVIYYLKDEYDNECPYDFKSIQFSFNGRYYYYTFSQLNSLSKIDGVVPSYETCFDASVRQVNEPFKLPLKKVKVHDNIIEPSFTGILASGIAYHTRTLSCSLIGGYRGSANNKIGSNCFIAVYMEVGRCNFKKYCECNFWSEKEDLSLYASTLGERSILSVEAQNDDLVPSVFQDINLGKNARLIYRTPSQGKKWISGFLENISIGDFRTVYIKHNISQYSELELNGNLNIKIGNSNNSFNDGLGYIFGIDSKNILIGNNADISFTKDSYAGRDSYSFSSLVLGDNTTISLPGTPYDYKNAQIIVGKNNKNIKINMNSRYDHFKNKEITIGDNNEDIDITCSSKCFIGNNNKSISFIELDPSEDSITVIKDNCQQINLTNIYDGINYIDSNCSNLKVYASSGLSFGQFCDNCVLTYCSGLDIGNYNFELSLFQTNNFSTGNYCNNINFYQSDCIHIGDSCRSIIAAPNDVASTQYAQFEVYINNCFIGNECSHILFYGQNNPENGGIEFNNLKFEDNCQSINFIPIREEGNNYLPSKISDLYFETDISNCDCRYFTTAEAVADPNNYFWGKTRIKSGITGSVDIGPTSNISNYLKEIYPENYVDNRVATDEEIEEYLKGEEI